MSHVKHNAIVVTSYSSGHIHEAKKVAEALGLQVLGESAAVINNFRSILICPDGSKEGWASSMAGDEKRAQFVEWLCSQAFEDGSSPLSWVHVEFGELDESGDRVPQVVEASR